MIWKDAKGREIQIQTMSNRWLNNIRKKFRGQEVAKPIIEEIKRRNKK